MNQRSLSISRLSPVWSSIEFGLVVIIPVVVSPPSVAIEQSSGSDRATAVLGTERQLGWKEKP